jgi:pimeloyl-ACP methyl ester carboxylesterase
MSFKERLKQSAIAALGYSINVQALFAPLAAGKRAVEVFRTPLSGRLREHHQTLLRKAQYELIETKEYRIPTYLWDHTGPTVLLAHGWQSNAARWRSLIDRLRKNQYRIVALDAPGHGASPDKYFDALLYSKHLQVVVEKFQPAFIIGHSAGGMAAMYYLAENRPTFVKGVAVMAAPGSLYSVLKGFQKVLKLSDQVMQQMERAFALLGYSNLRDFDLAQFAARIDLPALLLYDHEDTIATVGDGREVAEHWQGSRFMAFAGHGHSMQHKEVYQALEQFLAELR